MKSLCRLLRIAGLATFAVCLFTGGALRAADGDSSAPRAGVDNSPGAEAAKTLSQVTGIAISPLLGTAGIGAWRYFESKSADRVRLPWYAQPWFWGPALLIVGLCALKDAGGVVIPTPLKKPIDVLELFENKASGLLATGAIVPIALKTFHALDAGAGAAINDAAGHFAAIDLSWLGNLIIAPAALIVYGAVWLVSHTVHVFITLSPFGALDAALKSARAALLASVAGTHWLHSGLGAAWAGAIAIVCLLLAPWAFRLTVMGGAFGWDVLTFRNKRFTPAASGLPAFANVKVGNAPRRSFGVVRRGERGGFIFAWRPWLIFPSRTEALPAGRYFIGDGALYNEVQRDADSGSETLFNLPPRCNGHERAIAELYAFDGVRPAGLRAVWAWFKSLFTGTPEVSAQ
jgi:hypothetical protein